MCITRRQVLYRKPEPHPQGAAAGAKREGRGRGSESRRYSFWIHTPIPTHLILNSVIDPNGHGKAFFQISSSIKIVPGEKAITMFFLDSATLSPVPHHLILN